MLKGKTIDRICCVALAVMLALTALIWTGKSSAGKQRTVTVGYEDLFDTEIVHTIDIEMDSWDSFIANATQEEYTECSVTIDGEKVSNVGIRAKGNTSLSSVSSLGSQKYSFKIEFDQFVKGKTWRGLDKLSLNNLIYDATMMKDYLAYVLMAKMEVPSSLCSFVEVTVNGESWGLYLAVEGIEDGFMERNNMTIGELYKPDSLSFGGGRGNGRDFDFEQFRVKDEEETDATGEETPNAETVTSDTASAQPEGFSGQMPGGMSFPGSSQGSEGSGSTGSFQMPEGMSFPGSSQGSEGSESTGSFQMPGGMSFPGSGQGSEGSESTGSFQMPGGMSFPDNFQPSDGGFGGGSNQPGIFSFGGGMFNFGMGSSDVKLQYVDDDPDSYANIFDNAKTDVSKKDKARLIETLKTLNGENAQDALFTEEVIRYLAVHDFLQNDDSYTGMMIHNYYLYEEDGKLAVLPWDYNLAFGGMGSGGDASSTINSPIDSPVSNGSVADRPLISWIFEDEEALAQYHEIYSQFISEVIESGWLESEIARVAELLRPYVESDPNGFFTVEEFDTAIEALQSYCALRGESIRGQLEGTIPSTSDGQRADSSALVDTGSLDLSVMGSMNTGGGMGGNGAPSMPGGGSFEMPSGSFEMPSGSFEMPSGFTPPSGGFGGGERPSAGTDPAQSDETPAENAGEAQKPASGGMPSGDWGQMPSGGFSMGPGMDSGTKQTDWIVFGACVAFLLVLIGVAWKIRGHNE